MLAQRRLLEPLSRELQAEAGDALWASLRTLDEYRRRFESAPEALTNTILLGALILPLGSTGKRILQQQPLNNKGKEPRVELGLLPLARRDIDRLRQVLAFQRRLTDAALSPRARRALVHRGPFQDAVTWMELFGGNPSLAAEWRDFALEAQPPDADSSSAPEEAPRKRRRRRRRAGRRGPRPSAPE
jgi:poly(A) polymerase